MPRFDVGKVTPTIVSHRVAPMPNAASRSSGSTAAIASREIAVTVGRIMIVSTSAAGRRPTLRSGVLKSGNQPRCSCSQLHPGRIVGMTTKMPQADAEERCTEEREPTQVLVQPVASWSNRRNDDEDAPEPIDHAGDGREQRDDILQNALEPAWNEFLRQEYGDGDAEHRGKGDPDGRTHHRPDDLWQDSELPLAGVPMSRDNEPMSGVQNDS